MSTATTEIDHSNLNVRTLRERLLGSSSLAASVSGGAKAVPEELGHVMLTVDEDGAAWTAGDGNMAVTVRDDELRQQEPTALIFPAGKFADLIKALPPGGAVSLKSDTKHLCVGSGKSRLKILCRPAQFYPKLVKPRAWKCKLQVPAEKLLGMLNRVSFAAATNDVRTYLNGVLLEVMDEQLAVVATCGGRLACQKMSLEGHKGEFSVILPTKTVQTLSKMLAGRDEAVTVSMEESKVLFELDGLELLSNVIGGKYPDYRRVLPKKSKIATRVRVKRVDLLNAINRAGLMAKAKVEAIRLNAAGESLSAECAEAENAGEEAVDVISAEVIGEQVQAAYRIRFLSDVFRLIEDDQVEVGFEGDTQGAQKLILTSEKYPGFIFCAMPMRV